MHKIHELKEKLLEELGDYSDRNNFSRDDVESIKYMASAVDHLCNILEKYDDEYSNAMGSYDMDRSYDMGRSYARGRGSNAKRDSRGRYSSRNYSGNYAMAMDDMKSEIRELMNDAPNEQVKMEFQRFMNKLDQM